MRNQEPIPGRSPREYEAWQIEGSVQKNSYPEGTWTQREALEFTDKFLRWLDEQSLSFGGGLGVPYHEEED